MADQQPMDNALLALRGGLKGRLAENFCVLQSSIDALTRHLQQNADPALNDVAGTLLQEMADRIAMLERLADHAADLALSSAFRGTRVDEPVELFGYLQELCECAREELLLQELPVQLVLQTPQAHDTFWLMADPMAMNTLFTNLLTNSLQGGCTRVEFCCSADARLTYRDDGPGLPQEAAALLADGVAGPTLLCSGATGLLLVRACADALGWQTQLEAGEGCVLHFALPPACTQGQLDAVLRTAAQAGLRRQELLAQLRRELAAMRGR